MIVKRKILLLVLAIFVIFAILAILSKGLSDSNGVYLRKFPYPYQAALAICSDIDGTHSIEKFLSIQEFLSSTKQTTFGRGLGLETGNSFWFYNQYLQALKDYEDTAYVNSLFIGAPETGISLFEGTSDTLSPYAGVIQKLIKSGYIDCLHSFGEFADGGFSRNLALRAVDFFRSESLIIDVFTNHGGIGNTDNIGPAPHLRGDNPDSKEYHTDLTIFLGIKFLWRGQVTHCIGQDANFSLKDQAKLIYEWFQDFMNKDVDYKHDNSLIHVFTLDDGQKVFEFVRFINPLGKYPIARQEYMQYQLGPEVIDELIRKKGYLIQYTHLGTTERKPYLSPTTVEALGDIRKKNDEGKLLVTTTSKLLNYYVHSKYMFWRHFTKGDSLFIEIDSISNPVEGCFVPDEKDLEGITFYVPADKEVSLLVRGSSLSFIRNSKDDSGLYSISVPWNKLTYPFKQ